ncbi:YlzJ-like protein [Oceanobacillus limi]|uniref:YlzJ-like protein n=1 Tax=Oceanobacillus limi TaxID=930131 RepID=A0A1H9Z5D2_9BACI|nr:YlzJ-like family protein [Oceanobacillus limi]SES76706.1 YlzJ-like protein [Oceanobacillus limi]
MILYTPLAETDIFPHEAGENVNRECINYNGKQVFVEKNKDGSYQLLQLLSTDPQDFLDDNYSPGTIIN